MPAALQSTISAFMAAQGPAGAAVAVSTPSARYLSLNGYADVTSRQALTATDDFAFRSITKSFVGTVILQLVDEGRMTLTEPVATYIQGVPDGNAITVQDALEMRTGLVEYSDTPAFSGQLDSIPDYGFTDNELLLDAFHQPLDFAPGSDFEYSNTNFVLLGEVIAAVTGQSWDEQVGERILRPLGLASVIYPPDASLGAVIAGAYETTADGLEAIGGTSDTLYSAAGGLSGNIGDLLSWGRALGSGSLISPALQAERESPVSDAADGDFTPAYDAYGMALGQLDGWWGHTGVGLGYESLVMYNRATDTTVAILINTTLSDPNAAAALFRQLAGAAAGLP
jgi:D-alanyl-D-alanine carboxypeptidase